MQFADYIQHTIKKNNSSVVAGFDPLLETIPTVFLEEASKETSNEEYIFKALTGFYTFALKNLADRIAAVKPNIAFFEQYGIGGLRSLAFILSLARELKIPSILDAKRGDIGTTAESYSKAYLTGAVVRGEKTTPFEADSITVNPFLGFDTVKVFLDACIKSEKGIFVLVKTSNPGSIDLQDKMISQYSTVSEHIAEWIAEHASSLLGSSGISGLGAVVGATHPSHLESLRRMMPTALFLIPGMGAQGGTATDVVSGFTKLNHGALINLSRGLLSSFTNPKASKEILGGELSALADKFNREITQAQIKKFGD